MKSKDTFAKKEKNRKKKKKEKEKKKMTFISIFKRKEHKNFAAFSMD